MAALAKRTGRGSSAVKSWTINLAALAGLAVMLLGLGAWRDVSGNTINPRYVERIKDGVTTKHEVLALFGDPQNVERTAQGVVFQYASYKDAEPMALKQEKQIDEQSSTPFFLDPDKKVQKVPVKKGSKILGSTLTIWFKADGDTVAGHEYKQY
jgi:outer membrane protein assembly factor BamE (lipoprotein component of BamABCDE complex)